MPRRPGFAAVGMAAAVVGLAFTLSLAQWIPHSADARAGTSFRPAHPEIAYLPMGLR